MAIYPVLFLQYLRFFLPGLGRFEAWVVALAVIWGATWLNLRGTRVVGTASGWFVALVLAPFGVLAAVALARWLGQPATPFPTTPFHATGTSFLGALGIGVSQSIWNYSGWDNASTIGGEIEQASTTYPRALARTLPLVTVVYLVTILPALALTSWTTWTDGAWPRIAGVVVGPWLGIWIAGAGLVSAFALFNALLLAYSRIPLVLAQDGLLPPALAVTDERGTPRNAVLVSALAYSGFALIPFGGLLAGDVLLYSAALALEFGALLQLRRAEPGLRGAFRVPLGALSFVAVVADARPPLPAVRTISGRVTNSLSGDPVVGATVTVVGTPTTAVTSDKGEFSLSAPDGAITLLFRSVGYKRRTVPVAADQNRVDATLEPDVFNLEAVVITGQATSVEKRFAPNAVGTVGAGDLSRVPVPSVETAIQGKVPGAVIQQNSGAPGGGIQVKLRGVSTLNGLSSPLYVVDGVIMSDVAITNNQQVVTLSNSGSNPSPLQQNQVNRIADLNPYDIDNIEVLKGASAAAIYGSKAANGVGGI